MEDTKKQFLTDFEAAEVLHLSVKTLRRQRLTGDGPPFRKLGGAVRYRVGELEGWIAACPSGGGRVRAPSMRAS